jgi:hypothetical protein
MLRKSLFWGLTLVLAAALTSLMVRSSRLEKRHAGTSEEVMQESTPTPTRVLAPQDLEIVQQHMRLEKESDGKDQSQTATHAMEILNKGKSPYSSIILTISYMDRSGRVVATKTQSVEKNLMPGAAPKLVDIKITGVPASAASCRMEIVCADMGIASQLHQTEVNTGRATVQKQRHGHTAGLIDTRSRVC